ncbi:MAG: hypothetical protein Q8P18_06095 [Pseudomonadota bacterium]|nr:hypothetical protein [Pseudomonadota bacterium]
MPISTRPSGSQSAVAPHVATRQWVLTVPWKRRWLLARRPELACGVHAVAMRAIERWYATQGGAPKEGRTGSVTATQRFGSALNLNLHFHCISPFEFVERLVALVPPPRANQVIYRGVLAGNAAWRAEVVPKPPPEAPDGSSRGSNAPPGHQDPTPWATTGGREHAGPAGEPCAAPSSLPSATAATPRRSLASGRPQRVTAGCG